MSTPRSIGQFHQLQGGLCEEKVEDDEKAGGGERGGSEGSKGGKGSMRRW